MLNPLYYMQPKIKILSEKKLVGIQIKTTLSESEKATPELWKRFMMRRAEIKNKTTTDLFSVQLFDNTIIFDSFNENTVFEKWAAVEVSRFERIPEGMNVNVIERGLYAVFIYRGTVGEASSALQYIFGKWLPNSIYSLDNRAQFEIMGEKYNPDNPDSEEEIWIPIKRKKE